MEGRPWAEAAASGHVGQVNVNGHPAAVGSDVVSTAADSILVNDVHPISTVNTANVFTLIILV